MRLTACLDVLGAGALFLAMGAAAVATPRLPREVPWGPGGLEIALPLLDGPVEGLLITSDDEPSSHRGHFSDDEPSPHRVDDGGAGHAPPLSRSGPLPLSSVTASRQSRSTSGGISYGPWNAVDGAHDTGWQVSSGGIGEWIRLDFGGEVRLDRVGVVPGYDKWVSDRFGDRWPLNNRVSEALLEWERGSRVVRFRDDRAMQWTDLGGVTTRWIRLSVNDVAAGSRWNDTVISEIECIGGIL